MATGTSLICMHCGGRYTIENSNYSCPSCRAPLLLPFCATFYEKSSFSDQALLGEGNTPLISVEGKIPSINGKLHLKIETGNPTGSFKDRGSALVAREAKRLGYERLAIASTGNAGASMAAYCSRMGLKLTVIVPANTAPGKLRQLHYFGATVEEVNGDFSMAETRYEQLLSAGYYPAGPENPFRIEGIKSIAYEIVDNCQTIPDRVVVPIGTGGLMTSLYKGFQEMFDDGVIKKLPHLDAVQLGSVPSLYSNTKRITQLPKTVATGINISQPVMAKEVKIALEKTKGELIQVSDQEILLAQRELALFAGIGTEATGAATTAAYKKALQKGGIFSDELVVIPITGHMLKE